MEVHQGHVEVHQVHCEVLLDHVEVHQVHYEVHQGHGRVQLDPHMDLLDHAEVHCEDRHVHYEVHLDHCGVHQGHFEVHLEHYDVLQEVQKVIVLAQMVEDILMEDPLEEDDCQELHDCLEGQMVGIQVGEDTILVHQVLEVHHIHYHHSCQEVHLEDSQDIQVEVHQLHSYILVHIQMEVHQEVHRAWGRPCLVVAPRHKSVRHKTSSISNRKLYIYYLSGRRQQRLQVLNRISHLSELHQISVELPLKCQE